MSSDDVWTRPGEEGPIESPCIRVCVIHPQAKLCTGCLRTLEEVATWRRMSPEARQMVMAELESRRPLLQRRRGGRAARLARDAD